MVLNIRSLFAKKKGCSVAKKEALNEIGTPKQNNEVSTLLLHLAEKKADFVHNFTASPIQTIILAVVTFPTFIARNRIFFALWEILEQITKILYKTTDRIVL